MRRGRALIYSGADQGVEYLSIPHVMPSLRRGCETEYVGVGWHHASSTTHGNEHLRDRPCVSLGTISPTRWPVLTSVSFQDNSGTSSFLRQSPPRKTLAGSWKGTRSSLSADVPSASCGPWLLYLPPSRWMRAFWRAYCRRSTIEWHPLPSRRDRSRHTQVIWSSIPSDGLPLWLLVPLIAQEARHRSLSCSNLHISWKDPTNLL